MSVPDRVEAARALLALDPPPWHLRHSRGVAEIAGWLAARIVARGIAVDRRLVEAAGLLHDVDKALHRDEQPTGLRHGDRGAEWLTRKGYGELARPVANHPVTRLADEDRYRRWSAFATREERIVAYADKRCTQRMVAMAARFARWERRHPVTENAANPSEARWDRATLERVRRRAERLEKDVCAAAGVRPEDVGRLRWTTDAIRRARR
jgi:putative nucleotidyltransferase with HDIG domain